MNKEQREKLSDALKEAIGNMSDNRLVELWDDYCTKYVDGEFEVWDMDSFDAELRGLEPSTIVEMTNGGNFSTYNRYFRKTPYGNLESSNDPMELGIDIEKMASYMAENKDSLGYSEIEAILDEPFYFIEHAESNCCYFVVTDGDGLTEQKAWQVLYDIPQAKDSNVIIVRNYDDFYKAVDTMNYYNARAWEKVAIVYDSNSNDDLKTFCTNYCENTNMQYCEIDLDKLEKQQEQTKSKDFDFDK